MNDDVLSVDEVASRVSVHPKTLYESIRSGTCEIPGLFRIGRAIRFSRVVFEAWLCGTTAPGKPASSGEQP
jgi:excisionase family DNA binding protein